MYCLADAECDGFLACITSTLLSFLLGQLDLSSCRGTQPLSFLWRRFLVLALLLMLPTTICRVSCLVGVYPLQPKKGRKGCIGWVTRASSSPSNFFRPTFLACPQPPACRRDFQLTVLLLTDTDTCLPHTGTPLYTAFFSSPQILHSLSTACTSCL